MRSRLIDISAEMEDMEYWTFPLPPITPVSPLSPKGKGQVQHWIEGQV